MHAPAPEIRIFEIFPRLVTEPVPDVLADEGGREIARGPKAVDHGGRGREQLGKARMRRLSRLFRGSFAR